MLKKSTTSTMPGQKRIPKLPPTAKIGDIKPLPMTPEQARTYRDSTERVRAKGRKEKITNGSFDAKAVRGRTRFLSAIRRYLEDKDYLEVQTPVLQPRLSGFEKGTGFSTFSSSLGERLWFRAAPELYLKRLLIQGQAAGMDHIFELAICLRDEYNELDPRDSFDRPEFTLLEAYSCEDDPWAFEALLRGMLEQAAKALETDGLAKDARTRKGLDLLLKPWERREYAALINTIDPSIDLEALLRRSTKPAPARGQSVAAFQAEAIAARANDPALREAAANLAHKSGGMAQYLRNGPQGYWLDLLDHAFQMKVVPTLIQPTLVHRLPLESSPLAASSDGIHCEKWELYANGVRIALAQKELMDAKAQRVRFEHLDRLRRQGYELVPEPDEGFVRELEHWQKDRLLIGMGVYVDRLVGTALGLLDKHGRGQERMVPNLFKSAASKP